MDFGQINSIRGIPCFARGIGCRSAVEVGVQRGWFSRRIARAIDGDVWLVDPWMHFDEGYEDSANVPQAQQDANHDRVVRMFAGRPNVHVLRKTSLEAAAGFAGESVDWVFIDANHSYEAVRDDVRAWWPKVRPGGSSRGTTTWTASSGGPARGSASSAPWTSSWRRSACRPRRS